jgi:DNA-binding transcriptional LysR family regulator
MQPTQMRQSGPTPNAKARVEMLDYLRISLVAMGDGVHLREYKRFRTRRLEPACKLELRQLRAFVALIDEGSMTGAAHALKLAQSTVSEAIATLERTLGTSVVRRSRGTHDSVLTAAGEALLPNARELLAGVDKTYIAVAEAAFQARGTVDIVANESVSTYVLPEILAQIRGRWPNTLFSVSVATCADVQQGIEDGRFDLGLVVQGANGNASTTKIVSRCEHQVLVPLIPLVIFAAAATHPLLRGKPREAAAKNNLAGLALLVSDAVGEFHALVKNFFMEDGLPTARLQSAGSIEGVKRGVMADPCALGILPAYAIAEELRTGRFVRLNVCPAPPAIQLVALLSKVQERHPGADEIVEDIRHLLNLRSKIGIVVDKRSVE